VQFKRKELIMPSGIVSPHYKPTNSAPHRPGLLLRARVWTKNLELDALLADGADPAQSEELGLRAKQLAARNEREKLAKSIVHLIETAEAGGRAGMAIPYPPFRWKQIQADRSLLLELAERLRSRKPVALRGVALTSLLLEDGRGPLTTNSESATLTGAVRAALSALDLDPRRRQVERPRLGSSA
jgi:hypothetical protein